VCVFFFKCKIHFSTLADAASANQLIKRQQNQLIRDCII